MNFMPLFIFVIHVLYYGVMNITQPQCMWNATQAKILEEIDLNRNPILYDEERAWRKEMAMISWILGVPYDVMQMIEDTLNNITAPRNLDGDAIEMKKDNENFTVVTYIENNDTNNSGNLTSSTEIYNYWDYRILPNETLIAMR
ncbi:uncharacterized protein LOC122623922 [Drosophila teissieri]|uniref:uncharacterized protein LOC122623922 n=1 Tax=Drosophila teissieri TaxID=7243 RepID=UPI001CB9FE04|nr:uncharacterized protein LOC122623922 [Drosophila teissieri]